jgi:hypothetical protein
LVKSTNNANIEVQIKKIRVRQSALRTRKRRKIFISGLPPLRGLPKATGYAGGLLRVPGMGSNLAVKVRYALGSRKR